MKTLFDYAQPDPAREESVPLGPVPILNFPLVRQLIQEAFAKDPERTVLTLTSNGAIEKHATEWYVKRVLN